MKKSLLGELELDVLRHVTDHAPITVGEVASGFGEPRGLARTTILTVMDRLRNKGYLIRSKEEGIFRYTPRVEKSEVLRGLVSDFVERTLAGSVSPFVAYLIESERLSAEEMEALRKLVDRMESRKEEGSE
jgi:predicted transcriptional regulator